MIRSRALFVFAASFLAAACGLAQDWTVGGTYGLVNDVERRFRLDGFTPQDFSAWVDFRLDTRTLLRASYVDIHTNSDRSLPAQDTPPPQPIPRQPVGIRGVTVGVSYLASEGFFTSGIFAGIGGYRVAPISSPDLAPYLDARETVFGFHAGVDGDFRIVRQLSVVGRLTFHGILSESKRWLLSASVGLAVHL